MKHHLGVAGALFTVSGEQGGAWVAVGVGPVLYTVGVGPNTDDSECTLSAQPVEIGVGVQLYGIWQQTKHASAYFLTS